MTNDTDTPARAQERNAADWNLRRAIGNALGLKPHPFYEWGYVDSDGSLHQYDTYETDLNTAWRLQQQNPIPGTICLNLEWLTLPPEQAAYEMAKAWLRWATAAAAPRDAAGDG